MKKLCYLAVFIISVIGCTTNDVAINKTNQAKQYITILGTAQDGGFPHIGCQKKCCDDFYKGIHLMALRSGDMILAEIFQSFSSHHYK